MAWSDRRVLASTLTIMAIAVALPAQYFAHFQPDRMVGWILFALAAALAAAGATPDITSSDVPNAPRPTAALWAEADVTRRDSVRWRWPWAAGALLALIGTTMLSAAGRWPIVTVLLWLAGFAVASVAVRRWNISAPARAARPWTRAEITAVAGIVCVAAAARLLWIDALPRYYFGDEARVGMYLVGTYRERIPSFFVMGWNTWPLIGMSVQAMFVPVLGFSTTALRISSALMGTLAVLMTYLLVRELFSPRLGLLAALLFAICRTALEFSRLGVCHAQVLFLETFALWCWWRAVNTGRALYYLWAGIGLGFCLYTYNAGQLVPVLWLGWILLCAVTAPRLIRRNGSGALLTVGGFVLTQFPYIYYFTDHFAFQHNWVLWTCMARSRQTMSAILDAWHASGMGAAAAVLGRAVWLTWLGFTVLPMGSYGLGYRGGGMLDDVTGALFVLGLAVCLRRLLQPRVLFVVYWWAVAAVVGGVLTIDPPSFVRMVGILPVLALLAAFAVDGLWHALERVQIRRFAPAAVVALVVTAGWINWRTYFVAFAAGRVDDTSELARWVADVPRNATVYLLGSEHFLHFNHDVNVEQFAFEFPDRHVQDAPDPPHFLPLHGEPVVPFALVLGPTQVTLADYIRQLYPHTEVADVTDGGGRVMFRALRLDADEVQRHAGLQLEVRDAGDTVVSSGVADPFDAALGGEQAGAVRHWRGRVYWPTDRPVGISTQSTRPISVRVAGVTLGSAETEMQLPRGWQPVMIDEEAADGVPRSLSVSIREGPRVRRLTRWDFDPNTVGEGLLAIYARGDEILMRSIDPQLNSFNVEALFWTLVGPPIPTPVRMPFTVSWEGALRITEAGMYRFDVQGSGPYSVRLDGELLASATNVVPENPRLSSVSRSLSIGLHPLVAQWDSTKSAHTTRRLFQVYWTPPRGQRELIPPTHFVPAELKSN